MDWKNMTFKSKKNTLTTPSSGSPRHHFFLLFMHFYPGTMTTHTESINSDLQRGLDRHLRHTQHRTQNRTSKPLKYQRTTNTTATLIVLIIEFLQIQIPTDRTSGTRTRATQMLTNTIVETCSTRLTTAPRRHNDNREPEDTPPPPSYK